MRSLCITSKRILTHPGSNSRIIHTDSGAAVIPVSNDATRLTELEDAVLRSGKNPQRLDTRSPRSLYHAILIQLKLFPDKHGSALIKSLVLERYENNRGCSDVEKLLKHRVDAKKCLITLQKANLGDIKALQKVVDTAYGRRGRLRHIYLDKFTAEIVLPAQELIPGKSRSRPPVAGQKLQALWRLQFDQSQIEISLPPGPAKEFGKPLDKRREANLRWAHHTALLNKTFPPIPREDLAAVHAIASASSLLSVAKIEPWRRITIAEMEHRRSQKSTDPRTLTARTIRKLYHKVLCRSPILFQDLNGKWKAEYAQGVSRFEPSGNCMQTQDLADFDHIE